MKPSFASRATPATIGPKDSPFIARLKTLPPLEHGAFAGSSIEKPNTYLVERYEALHCALTQPAVATYTEPAELINRSNGSQGISRQGMHARAASRKAQRAIGERIARAFQSTPTGRLPVGPTGAVLFWVVVLTRIAPRSLDLTNLDHCFKSVIDGIATGLGIDDRSNLVRYVTTQESGGVREHSVKASLHVSPQGEAP